MKKKKKKTYDELEEERERHLEKSIKNIGKINNRLSEAYLMCVELECYNLEKRK